MEHLDKRIATIANKHKKKEKVKKTWEEQLSEMIEAIPKSSIELDGEDIEMKQLSLFDGCLNVYVPKDFFEVSLDTIKRNYPYVAKPQIIYQNKRDTINIGFTMFEDIVEETELILFCDIMKNSFIKVNPASKILDDGDFLLGGKLVVYYTFTSFALDGQNYNLMFLTLVGSHLFLCTLTCIKKDMDKIKPLFYGIMKTIEIKEIVSKEREEEIIEKVDEQKQSPNQLIFDKKQLLSLPIISALSIRHYRIFICKNENGETPLNNMYALNEEGEFLWSVNLCENGIDKPLPNEKSFINMEKRGEYALLGLDEEEGVAENGYYINVSDGRMLYPINMETLRRQEKERKENL